MTANNIIIIMTTITAKSRKVVGPWEEPSFREADSGVSVHEEKIVQFNLLINQPQDE